jgi:hypothetical protein
MKLMLLLEKQRRELDHQPDKGEREKRATGELGKKNISKLKKKKVKKNKDGKKKNCAEMASTRTRSL